MRYFKSLALATFLYLAPFLANASIFQFDFSGTIGSLTPGGASLVISDFSIGDAVVGSIQYDTTALGGISSETRSNYNSALLNFDLSIGGIAYNATGGNITVDNDDMAGSAAPLRDGVVFQGVTGLTGPNSGGVAPARLQFALGSTDTSVLGSTDLVGPVELAALWAVNTHGTNLNFISFANGDDARFNLDSVQVEVMPAVPVPAAVWLFGTALIGFIGYGKRRKVA